MRDNGSLADYPVAAYGLTVHLQRRVLLAKNAEGPGRLRRRQVLGGPEKRCTMCSAGSLARVQYYDGKSPRWLGWIPISRSRGMKAAEVTSPAPLS